MCCEVRVAASSDYPQNHSGITHKQLLVGARTILATITTSNRLVSFVRSVLAFRPSPSPVKISPVISSIAIGCPFLHYPHHISFFSFVSVLFPIKLTNHSPPRCFAPNLTASPAPHDMTVLYLVIIRLKDVPGHAWIGYVGEGGVKMWCGDVTLLS